MGTLWWNIYSENLRTFFYSNTVHIKLHNGIRYYLAAWIIRNWYLRWMPFQRLNLAISTRIKGQDDIPKGSIIKLDNSKNSQAWHFSVEASLGYTVKLFQITTKNQKQMLYVFTMVTVPTQGLLCNRHITLFFKDKIHS